MKTCKERQGDVPKHKGAEEQKHKPQEEIKLKDELIK